MEPEYSCVLVMDLAEQSLQTLLSTQRIAGHDVNEITRLFDGVVSKLEDVHYSGVLHNDIKPRNILLDNERRVILCDLDAAMPLSETQSSGEATPYTRPRTGKRGSSGYHAPEVAQWEADDSLQLMADAASDVWSLGVMLFELCSGRKLFVQDINDDKIVSSMDKQRLHTWIGISEAELAEVLPGHDEAIRDAASALIRWCLMGNPSDRPSLEQIRGHRFLSEGGWLQSVGMALDPPPKEVPANTPIRTRDQRRMRFHMMITHFQSEAAGDTGALASALEHTGMHVWRDVNMRDLTLPGMCQGVMDSDILIVMLSNAVLSRWFCLMEITWALHMGKQIIFVQETDARFYPWDYDRWVSNRCTFDKASAEWKQSDDLQVPFERCQTTFPDVVAEVTRQTQSGELIAYRRRDYERDGTMVQEIMRRAADPALPPYAPRSLPWGRPMPQHSDMGTAMADARVFICYNPFSGEEIKQQVEGFLQTYCASVTSSSDAETEALIQAATHYVALLTEESVTPGEDSLAHMQMASSQGRPLEFVFRQPFFEEHMGAAPEDIKETLRGKEALAYRGQDYERKGMLRELLTRLSKATSTTQIGLNSDAPPPPPFRSTAELALSYERSATSTWG